MTTPNYIDIGVQEIEADGALGMVLVRVKDNPSLGQYQFYEDEGTYQFSPDQAGHFIGMRLSMETLPGTLCLKAREPEKVTFKLTGKTVYDNLNVSLDFMHESSLVNSLAHAYVQAVWPNHPVMVEADDNPLWMTALRMVRFFVWAIRAVNANDRRTS